MIHHFKCGLFNNVDIWTNRLVTPGHHSHPSLQTPHCRNLKSTMSMYIYRYLVREKRVGLTFHSSFQTQLGECYLIHIPPSVRLLYLLKIFSRAYSKMYVAQTSQVFLLTVVAQQFLMFRKECYTIFVNKFVI